MVGREEVGFGNIASRCDGWKDGARRRGDGGAGPLSLWSSKYKRYDVKTTTKLKLVPRYCSELKGTKQYRRGGDCRIKLLQAGKRETER